MKERSSQGLTNKQLQDLLPKALKQIGVLQQGRPDLIVAAWPQLIGDKLASMTRASSFHEGILHVKVANSTLYSLLAQHERGRLLKKLRERFPSVEIKNICFRMG
jgi:hypothetical protein